MVLKGNGGGAEENVLQRARHLGAVGLPQPWNLGVGFPSEDRNEGFALIYLGAMG